MSIQSSPPPQKIWPQVIWAAYILLFFTFESTELLEGVVLGRPVDAVPEFSLEDADDAWFKGFRVEI